MTPPQYRHGFNVYGPPESAYPLNQNASKAGELQANILRLNVDWHEARRFISGGYNYAYLDGLRETARIGRAANSQSLTILPVIDGTPEDVPGRDPGGRYVTTDEGYNQYGRYLGEYCDLVELSNEPNTARTVTREQESQGFHGNQAGTEIPPYHYGNMVAYATHWMVGCSGARRPLAGALATNQGGLLYLSGGWAFYVALFNYYAYNKLSEINGDYANVHKEWRLSFHAYPRLGSGPNRDVTGLSGANTVFAVADDVLSRTDSYRRIWLTETGFSNDNPNGAAEQANFADYVHGKTLNRSPRLEGLTFWPLTDTEVQVDDINSAFYHLAFVYRNHAPKPAGYRCQSNWS